MSGTGETAWWGAPDSKIYEPGTFQTVFRHELFSSDFFLFSFSGLVYYDSPEFNATSFIPHFCTNLEPGVLIWVLMWLRTVLV